MREGAPDQLQQRLQAKYPNASFEMTRFDSGAWLLDMRLAQRFFVISFSPTDGYGWEEVKDEHGFTSTFSNAAADEDDLFGKLTRSVGT